ncbi:ABC transporter ATP-binding protein [Alkalicoccus luteus]|uniref:ABC transporter ATP-binding protein n=1 Tax=Alkalicoccus luteus TaxID=1237094 RepID=A0A969PP47_9BACI|nr:ABC transporter ATP-binding protein [Alkalicoccus luteus]NJP37797.1 ABC transporter ATP-binding protein [Alkalicoccus luteus]
MGLKLDQLTKVFQNETAVNALSAEIKPGTIFGMLGSNGAGKTTTFRMILGLIDPTEGKAEWHSTRLSYQLTRLVGYLPEERGLYPKLTVKQQLHYFMKLKGMHKKEFREEMRSWLSRFQIEEYENRRVEELSKGNQQKIQFMASVLHKPELLILDEPFSGLDPVNSDMLKRAVLDLQKQGTTILFSSHQMHNVEELCDELMMLKKGNVILQGKLAEIKSSYPVKSIVIRGAEELPSLDELPGVLSIRKGKLESVVQVSGAEAAERVFRRCSETTWLKKFDLQEPSLHEIFVDQMGGEEHA